MNRPDPNAETMPTVKPPRGKQRLDWLQGIDETMGPPYALRIDRLSVQRVLLEIALAIVEEIPAD